jgi:hypothetical protein
MDHINKSLAHLFRDLPESERQWKKHDKLVEIGRNEAPAELGFMARMMVLCTLPHSDPGDDVREFSRRNGNYELWVQAGPNKKLPSGSYPRLLFAWICREIIRTKDRELVLGDSLSDFMRELGLEVTGGRWGTIARFKNQVERTLHARILALYETESEDGMKGRSSGKYVDVAEEWDLWWDYSEPNQSTFWQSTLTVGKGLYDEIMAHPVPFDMRVMKAIKQSPLAIDLYLWLTFRMSYLNKPVAIGWKQLHEQFGADYSQVNNFRTKCLKYLTDIQKAWPELHFTTPRGRLKLIPSGPHIDKIESRE